MRIAVFGVGGASGYFGGRLAEAGQEVHFIARGAHLAAIRHTGLRVDSVAGDFVVHPAHATDAPSEVGAVDCVLLGVKTWQVKDAAEAMRPLLGAPTVVLPLQNGVEAHTQLVAVLGRVHVLGGAAKIVSYLAGPGHIRHAGVEPTIIFGELDARRSERVEAIHRAFQSAKAMTAVVSDNIEADLWAKFVFIAGWGGVAAVTRAPVGVLRTQPETRRMLETAMAEILEVARARGVQVADDLVARSMAFVDNLPSEATASMQRDVIDGKPSELDHWTGAVIRLGAEAGVATPTHSFIYNTLLPLERRARGKLQF